MDTANASTHTIPSPDDIRRMEADVRGVLHRMTDLRSAAGMSQTDVAAACGVTKSAVSRWESMHRAPVGFPAFILRGLLADWGAFGTESDQ